MGNLAFTLYEVFGYLLPGGVTFLAFVVLYWASFVPDKPLGIASFQAGFVTWSAVTLASYMLGHAVQAIANKCLHGAESSFLDAEKGTAPKWMRERARQKAADVLKVGSSQELEPKWVFRSLDEYALQMGKAGDREIFVYREGFYRGTALALLFLSLALVVRMFVPGASIRFANGLFHISFWQLLVTAVILCAVAYLYVRRYRRFAEYRIARAVISALVIESGLKGHESSGKDHSRPE